MKIKDNVHNFVSITDNKELWDEVLNASERNAVLIVGAAFDTQLEKLLKKRLIQESSVTNKIAEFSSFSSKINLCFCLGILSEDERHDLNLLRDIRNAFSHNIFDCDFNNVQVSEAISNLIIPRKAKAIPEAESIKQFFNIGVVILDGFLKERLESVLPIKRLANINFKNKNKN